MKEVKWAAHQRIHVTSNKSSVAYKRSITYNMWMQVASNEGSMRLFRMVRSFPDEPGDVFYVGLIGLLPRVCTPCRWDDTAQCARFVEPARGFHRDHQLAVAMADHFARRWQRQLALHSGKHLQCTR